MQQVGVPEILFTTLSKISHNQSRVGTTEAE